LCSGTIHTLSAAGPGEGSGLNTMHTHTLTLCNEELMMNKKMKMETKIERIIESEERIEKRRNFY
jgi:hypothetical protein